MTRRILPVVAALLMACGEEARDEANAVAPPCDEPVEPGHPLGVRCGQLVDEEGRVVFLRGVNARVDGLFDVRFDDGREPLEDIPAFDHEDAAAMRELGFDALRLPVNWSGIEPTEDGGLDEAYLDRLRVVIDTAANAGLLVLVDFHQDAYSKEIGEDGAPLWAIDPAPLTSLGGPLDDLEQRRLSGPVLAAFETFFGDGARGAALRARYVAMTTAVAAAFADHQAVIGFEIFNEPVTDEAGVARLNEAAYARMRERAPDKLYVFEPSAFRNLLDQASLPAESLGPMTAYAPHVYTFALTGDGPPETLDKEQLRRSNENARIEADAWRAPLLITEWGVSPSSKMAPRYLGWQSELQQEVAASSFFWLWKESSQGRWGCFERDEATGAWQMRDGMRDALATIRAARVAGWPERSRYDHDAGVLELSFWSLKDTRAPHQIAVAPALGGVRVTCDGQEVATTERDVGMLEVQCGGNDQSLHRLRVERRSP